MNRSSFFFALMLSLFHHWSLMSAEIIAHRGASQDAPENTLPAVRLGWTQKADAVEIDIHLTRDGKIVAMHDADAKRTAGNDTKIAQSSLSELQKLDAGAWKGGEWKGVKIPALDEILPTIPPGKKLFIEIKCGPEVLPELGRALASAKRPPNEIVIIGFSFETVRAAKAQFPELQVYWLSSFKKDKETGRWEPNPLDLIEPAVAAKLDGLNLRAEPEVLNAEVIRKIRAAGLKFYVWTVDDPKVARAMLELGVDGITTNRPEWLRRELGL